jgi:hypothetical protein
MVASPFFTVNRMPLILRPSGSRVANVAAETALATTREKRVMLTLRREELA